MPHSVIYDLGANNGDDTAYYLKKADLVIAVEANPLLCTEMRQRFGEAVAAGRLVIENAVLTAGPSAALVPFHLHRTNHVLSQLPPPAPGTASDFEVVTLPALQVADLFRRHGAAHYVKVDLEHYDGAVLRALFDCGVFPDYLSAEAHDAEVFRLMVRRGGYGAFKLVDGRSVAERYGRHFIETSFGRELHEFPFHSAGPFGNDIPGNWMPPLLFARLLHVVGLGWKDVHASRIDAPLPRVPKWLLPQGGD